jgi:hypothetical protein
MKRNVMPLVWSISLSTYIHLNLSSYFTEPCTRAMSNPQQTSNGAPLAYVDESSTNDKDLASLNQSFSVNLTARNGATTATSHKGRTSHSTVGDNDSSSGLSKFCRKIKDRLTNTTHEQRETERLQRAEHEAALSRQQLAFHRAVAQAAETGAPQLLGVDKAGREVYISPPHGRRNPGSGGEIVSGVDPYDVQGTRGHNPSAQGVYANPNARFIRPNRDYASAYGGGYGMPVTAGMGSPLGGLMF